jgi:hypothetical protein
MNSGFGALTLSSGSVLSDINVNSDPTKLFPVVWTLKKPTIAGKRVSVEDPMQVEDPNAPNPTFLRDARDGLLHNLSPKLTLEGTGGTYILSSRGKPTVAVFKPSDEEAFAPSNPRGHTGRLGSTSFRKGVLSGESAKREVAAFLLDHGGFSRVPETLLVKIRHDSLNYPKSCSESYLKQGSLQQFIDNDGPAEDWGPASFQKTEVERIAILDLRVLNMDRNAGNLLV